jgi:hypothetical protein
MVSLVTEDPFRPGSQFKEFCILSGMKILKTTNRLMGNMMCKRFNPTLPNILQWKHLTTLEVLLEDMCSAHS